MAEDDGVRRHPRVGPRGRGGFQLQRELLDPVAIQTPGSGGPRSARSCFHNFVVGRSDGEEPELTLPRRRGGEKPHAGARMAAGGRRTNGCEGSDAPLPGRDAGRLTLPRNPGRDPGTNPESGPNVAPPFRYEKGPGTTPWGGAGPPALSRLRATPLRRPDPSDTPARRRGGPGRRASRRGSTPPTPRTAEPRRCRPPA